MDTSLSPGALDAAAPRTSNTSTDTPTTNSGSSRHHRGLKAVLIIFVILLACVAAYAFVLHDSISRAQTLGTRIEQQVQVLQTATEQFDLATITSSSSSLSSDLASLKGELDGWQWSVAACLPHYGDDVSAARRLVDTADSLAQGLLLPAVSVANDYVSSISAKGILGVFDSKLADKVGDVLTQGASIIQDANSQLEAIRPVESQEINEAVSKLKTPVSKMAHLLDQYGTLVGHLEGLFT